MGARIHRFGEMGDVAVKRLRLIAAWLIEHGAPAHIKIPSRIFERINEACRR